ncbi:hypothetical protein GDO81_029197 [Engystomops pustulosus]|uniref:Uncharacterized protein n=1 Tax=Engystomops pustulosus TaxID=76066 RepID=A0AAV6YCC9_ENGPU|nr:hypothetical protein GDO81_029197 [Engystomops pustulosus]
MGRRPPRLRRAWTITQDSGRQMPPTATASQPMTTAGDPQQTSMEAPGRWARTRTSPTLPSHLHIEAPKGSQIMRVTDPGRWVQKP